MFGGLNTIFSGFAFLGLIVAIGLQRKELHEQQRELKLATQAHQETSATLKAQYESAERSARIQGLNLLIVAERTKLEKLHEPSTVGEVLRGRRTAARLATLEQSLEELIAPRNGAEHG